MTEYISRDKAREIIENQQKAVCYNGRWGRGAAIDVGKYDELETVLDSIDAIPAAEVEPVRQELRKAVKLLTKNYDRGLNSDYVCNPVAWALYQTWKEMDGGIDNGNAT